MNGGQVAEKGETLFPTSWRCPQLYPLSTSLNDSLGISWAPGLCWTWGREAQSLNKDYLAELERGGGSGGGWRISKPLHTGVSAHLQKTRQGPEIKY